MSLYVRWLDEIEDFRFDVTYLPGAKNPTDSLSRRGFADGDGPAPTTGPGEPEPESQQELFSRHGRDSPPSVLLAAVRGGWGSTRRVAAATFKFAGAPGGGAYSPPNRDGGVRHPPRVPVCLWNWQGR